MISVSLVPERPGTININTTATSCCCSSCSSQIRGLNTTTCYQLHSPKTTSPAPPLPLPPPPPPSSSEATTTKPTCIRGTNAASAPSISQFHTPLWFLRVAMHGVYSTLRAAGAGSGPGTEPGFPRRSVSLVSAHNSLSFLFVISLAAFAAALLGLKLLAVCCSRFIRSSLSPA